MKKLLSLIVALAMIASMGVAFAEGGEAPYMGEVEVFNAEAANVGLCTGWMPDYIRKACGVDMIGVANEENKFALLVAGGSLPDVCVIGGGPIGLMMVRLARLSGASAVILSELFPESIWMAYATITHVVPDLLDPLEGRTVTIFPSTDDTPEELKEMEIKILLM